MSLPQMRRLTSMLRRGLPGSAGQSLKQGGRVVGHHTEAFVGIDAEPGCPGDEQVFVAVDPVAADESSEDAAIDAAWCAQVDVFHARNRGKESAPTTGLTFRRADQSRSTFTTMTAVAGLLEASQEPRPAGAPVHR